MSAIVHAARQDVEDAHGREAGALDLHAVRVDRRAVGHDVVAELAARRLAARVDLALGRLDALGHLLAHVGSSPSSRAGPAAWCRIFALSAISIARTQLRSKQEPSGPNSPLPTGTVELVVARSRSRARPCAGRAAARCRAGWARSGRRRWPAPGEHTPIAGRALDEDLVPDEQVHQLRIGDGVELAQELAAGLHEALGHVVLSPPIQL